MDGDEKVRIGIIGDVGTSAERDIPVIITGHDDFYVRIGGTDFFREPFGDVEGQVLLVGLLVPTDASGIMSAVSRIDDDLGQVHGTVVLCRDRHGDCYEEGGRNGR